MHTVTISTNFYVLSFYMHSISSSILHDKVHTLMRHYFYVYSTVFWLCNKVISYDDDAVITQSSIQKRNETIIILLCQNRPFLSGGWFNSSLNTHTFKFYFIFFDLPFFYSLTF